MFDISFAELMAVTVVALLVVGPEKLPKLARTVGAFVGRMQRLVAQVKEEVNREARFEELQGLQQEVELSARQFESAVRQEVDKAELAKDKMTDDVADALDASTQPDVAENIQNKRGE